MNDDPAEEAERRRGLHGLEQQARKAPREPGQPAPDPVHLILVRVPGAPPRRGLATWSLLTRLTRDATALGQAAEITDLGTYAAAGPALFEDGTRIIWLK